jgi:hypothetical protein
MQANHTARPSALLSSEILTLDQPRMGGLFHFASIRWFIRNQQHTSKRRETGSSICFPRWNNMLIERVCPWDEGGINVSPRWRRHVRMRRSETEESDRPEDDSQGDGTSSCLAMCEIYIDIRLYQWCREVPDALSCDIIGLWVSPQEANASRWSDGCRSRVKVKGKIRSGHESFPWICE